jgi:transcriptional regulator with XRE-family HTH domain
MPSSENSPLTFGKRIAEARKALGLSLKELAQQIKKEDGQAISPQYLNDIEHNRRQPDSSQLIEQFAEVLKIAPELLYFEAGKLTDDLRQQNPEEENVVAAYQAFRKALRGK